MYFKGRHKRDDLYSTPELKERGWTDAIIRDLLGEHDDTRPNPHYSSAGAPMRFWLKERADAIARTTEFAERVEKARRRAQSGRSAAAARRRELLRLVDRIEITVRKMPLEDAVDEAIWSFNCRGWYLQAVRREYLPFDEATKASDPRFLDRITVNYLRHHPPTTTRSGRNWRARSAGRTRTSSSARRC
jgi:hypothetical protein